MYRKSKAQIICDAICGILMLVSILVFILVGIFANIWHPTWIVIPCTGIVCGIVSIVISSYSNLKSNNERAIILIHHETKSTLESLKNLFNQNLKQMPQTIIFTIHEFIKLILKIHQKQFNLKSFNIKMNSYTLESFVGGYVKR